MGRILVAYTEAHPVRIDRFRESVPGHEVGEFVAPAGGHGADAEDELIEALEGHDALFTRSVAVPRRVFDAVPSLRAVVTHSSGYDHIDLEAATENGIVVVHTPEGPGPGVVEHVFAFAFLLLRDLPDRFDRMREGDWFGARGTVPELGGRTVGVVGLGTIGFDVARIASEAFGAEVLGYDPYVAGERESPIYPRVDRRTVEGAGVELVGLDALFERADLVTLHTPLTDETRHLVGERELSALGEGYLVNCARGGVVDEDALLAALEDGALAGAALDVFEDEPTDNDALLAHPNVHATPHIAGVTDGYLARAASLGAEKVRTALEGGRPDAVVNPEALE